MASFLLKINCILPILKTKKTLFTHFQQCVLAFNSRNMLLKSKDNTVVAKQQSAEMLNIYKVLFSLTIFCKLLSIHPLLIHGVHEGVQRTSLRYLHSPDKELMLSDSSSPAQPPRRVREDPGTLSQYTRLLPRLPGDRKRQLD